MKKSGKILINIVIVLAVLVLCGSLFIVFHSLLRRSVMNTSFGNLNRVQMENSRKFEDMVDAWKSVRSQQEWNITAKDKTPLYAVFFPVAGSHKYVIFCHGYGDSTQKFENITVHFANRNFNVLMPNLRGHGKTGSRFVGMGYPDSDDMLLWIREITKLDPDAEIVLMGLSMGSATVLMTSGLQLPENVKCVVADSAYASVWKQFRDRLKIEFNLPPFPVLNVASGMSKLLAGYTFGQASPEKRVRNSQLPTLFIHGEKDAYVQIYMLDDIISAYGGPYYEKLIIPDSEHVRGYLYYPELYFTSVFSFVDKYVE